MKYSRFQFTNEYYKLWELGLTMPDPPAAENRLFCVKFRKNQRDDYSRVTLKARSISDALERACYAVSLASPWRPEDIDLHAVYDDEENLLWLDEPFYEVVQKRGEFRGMDRRSFLCRFAATSAVILFGLRPFRASAGSTVVNMSGTASGFSGEQLYTTAGTYSWTVPANVTSVCVVCVGGGGGPGDFQSQGGGGGLGWKNSIAVTPSNSVSVVVGAKSTTLRVSGGNSYFSNTTTVCGYGGQGGQGTYTATATGGSYVGGGGGAGGNSPGQAVWHSYSGGGGAGGYAGAGGNGGLPTNSTTASTVGSAGAGGGGGGGSGARPVTGGGYPGGSGGGVGLYGQGTNGAAGATATTGSTSVSGKDGSPGSGGSGTSYGGGTGGNTAAGGGAVRIIWGAGRSFPSSAA